MLFSGDYQFKGTHADRVNRLTAVFSGNDRLFARNLDVYILAPVVGFLFNRTASLDNTGKPANILYDAMSKELPTLRFNYSLIMLLDEAKEQDFNKRVDKAFRHYGKECALIDEDRYEEFVRGGVDVLYEKLIEKVNTEEDYLINLYEFIEDFENRYGQNSDEIVNLCQLARS